jgi:hypothetical protein
MISPFLFRKPFSLLPKKKKTDSLIRKKKTIDLFHVRAQLVSLLADLLHLHSSSLSLGELHSSISTQVLFLSLNPNLSFCVCVKVIEYFSLWGVFWVAIEGLFGWIIVV